MRFERKKLYTAVALATIVVLGAGLHFYRIWYPASPVFDEQHFATYAADYVNWTAFEDIHPPLGKLIFASVLALYPRATVAGGVFVNIVFQKNGPALALPVKTEYGDFPYVALRSMSALFGILLPVALYFFMRSIDAGEVPSLVAAVLVLFDNAILVNTRLILMDGMFLLFGLIALALYFTKPRRSLAAGFFWGLCLSVKLTGIVFAGPLVAALFLSRAAQAKEEARRAKQFAVMGMGVLLAFAITGMFFFTPQARLAFIGFDASKGQGPTGEWFAMHPVKAFVYGGLTDLSFALEGYTTGYSHPAESAWYFWPEDEIPMNFYSPAPTGVRGAIWLMGNPVVWLASTLAVALMLAFSVRYGRRYGQGDDGPRPFFVLLGGYIFSMAPFVVLVHRSTFIYHYFPSLLFACGLAALFLGKAVGVRAWADLTPRKGLLLATALAAVAAGFLALAPVTYGL